MLCLVQWITFIEPGIIIYKKKKTAVQRITAAFVYQQHIHENSPFCVCAGVFADILTFLACSCRYLIWSAMTVSLLPALALMKSSP